MNSNNLRNVRDRAYAKIGLAVIAIASLFVYSAPRLALLLADLGEWTARYGIVEAVVRVLGIK